jgi:hypothetical protein
MSRDEVIQYLKNTTPAEVAAVVVAALSFDDALTAGEWIIARARKEYDDRNRVR